MNVGDLDMDSIWKSFHINYRDQEWVDKPSIFAEEALPYFCKTGRVLDLGAGVGQDSLYFTGKGYEVVSTDIDTTSLESSIAALSEEFKKNIRIQKIDLRENIPFENNAFDIVYAHLSLHYFDHEITIKIVNEIKRILKPGGVFAYLANSTSDPEYGTGNLLENDFFHIGKVSKRYFSIEYARQIAQDFQINLLDDRGETYKDRAIGVHHLIRFIGTKRT